MKPNLPPRPLARIATLVAAANLMLGGPVLAAPSAEKFTPPIFDQDCEQIPSDLLVKEYPLIQRRVREGAIESGFSFDRITKIAHHHGFELVDKGSLEEIETHLTSVTNPEAKWRLLQDWAHSEFGLDLQFTDKTLPAFEDGERPHNIGLRESDTQKMFYLARQLSMMPTDFFKKLNIPTLDIFRKFEADPTGGNYDPETGGISVLIDNFTKEKSSFFVHEYSHALHNAVCASVAGSALGQFENDLPLKWFIPKGLIENVDIDNWEKGFASPYGMWSPFENAATLADDSLAQAPESKLESSPDNVRKAAAFMVYRFNAFEPNLGNYLIALRNTQLE